MIVHHLQAVAVVEPEAAGIVAVSKAGRLQDVWALLDDGVLGAITDVVVGVFGGWCFDRRWQGRATPACRGARVFLSQSLGRGLSRWGQRDPPW